MIAPRKIYLSPPHMGADELALVKEAFDSNWIAPEGPHLRAFEEEVAALVGVPHALAVSSGTAAMHLALRALRLPPGSEVLCSTFTFAASANVVTYEGARPVFIDSERASWNMDPELLEEELEAGARRGARPRVAIVVDLYGQCADYERIAALCDRHGVTLMEDAAEALGATCAGRMAGAFGACAAFSFNGNKIITTSGGGMLVSHDRALIDRARFLATQARDPAPHYQHSEIGFNYRLSNVLAAIGRGQLRLLEERVAARRRNFEAYRQGLASLPGVAFMPEASYGRCTRWLTCLTIDPHAFGATRDDVIAALAAEGIEARPVWKPMHLQPVFASCRVRDRGVARALFESGLCLPSGSSLSRSELATIIGIVEKTCRGRR